MIDETARNNGDEDESTGVVKTRKFGRWVWQKVDAGLHAASSLHLLFLLPILNVETTAHFLVAFPAFWSDRSPVPATGKS
jgi:hypothetical protein